MLPYILTRFIQHFTQVKFSIISPKYNYVSQVVSSSLDVSHTNFVWISHSPCTLHLTSCPSCILWFNRSNNISYRVISTTSSTLGLCNSVFLPVTCSVLEPIVDMRALCSKVNYKTWLPRSSTAWPLKMGQTGSPETSVTNYQPTLRNIPEDHSCIGKGKATPVQTLIDSEGSRRVRFPDFKTIGTWRW
jgi:hypothetical protein